MSDIILVGGGGHCKSVIDVIESGGEFKIIGILDLPAKVGETVLGYKIIGSDDDITASVRPDVSYIITAGQISSPDLRRKLFDRILSAGGVLATAVSPYATVSKHAKLGVGTVVFHNAIVNADAIVGKNCIINSGALIEHDAIIGDHVHISTMAAVNGGCRIDDEVFVGSNSVISHGVSVVRSSIIGAGTVVHRDIKEAGTYVGNPFKKIV